MDYNDLENYIKSLKEYEKLLNEDDGDLSTINDLNKLLNDIQKTVTDVQSNNFILEVGFQKLHMNAVIPFYAKPGDAGMDLTVTEILSNNNKEITYAYGLAVEIPVGYVGLIFPRSSVREQDLILSNCVGVIDSGYRGELMSTFKKIHKDDRFYKIGERAAQILILPFPRIQPVEKKELSKSERNTGGFGHTGN